MRRGSPITQSTGSRGFCPGNLLLRRNVVKYGHGCSPTVARLQITLDGVKPAVLRPVEVPFDIRLDRLHLTIQAANRQGMSRTHAFYKMIAMVRGANIVRRELGTAGG